MAAKCPRCQALVLPRAATICPSCGVPTIPRTPTAAVRRAAKVLRGAPATVPAGGPSSDTSPSSKPPIPTSPGPMGALRRLRDLIGG
jgi:hypothetical protein